MRRRYHPPRVVTLSRWGNWLPWWAKAVITKHLTRPSGRTRTRLSSPSSSRVVAGLRPVAALLLVGCVALAGAKWQGDPPTHRVTLYPPTGTIVPHWKVRRPWLLENGAVCWRNGVGPELNGVLPRPILSGQVCVIGTVTVDPL